MPGWLLTLDGWRESGVKSWRRGGGLSLAARANGGRLRQVAGARRRRQRSGMGNSIGEGGSSGAMARRYPLKTWQRRQSKLNNGVALTSKRSGIGRR
jgi:hypothetical protein